MIPDSRGWLRRNRTNFAVGAGILGAGYLAGQYLISKVSEARQRISDDRIARENLRRRFEQNQEDCTFTVIAILPTATENIIKALPVEDIVTELQRQKVEKISKSQLANDGESSIAPSVSAIEEEDSKDKSLGGGQGQESSVKKPKIQLWNEMKIESITRAFALVYTVCLLTLTTRIQLNLLGRRNYLASVVSLATPSKVESQINLENHDNDNVDQAYGNDFEINRKYLSFSWWLLHRGCKTLMRDVMAAVEDVFGPINPRADISLALLSELTVKVRQKIEGDDEENSRSANFLQYILPPPSQESLVLQKSGTDSSVSPNLNIPPALRRLIDETSDIIESPSFNTVLKRLLDVSFSILIDIKLASHAFKIPLVSSSPSRITELVNPESASTKVASCLAVFCRQAQNIGSGSNNEYLDALEGVKELEAFSAIVYSSNFSFESPSFEENMNSFGEFKDAQLRTPTPAPNKQEKIADLDEMNHPELNSAWERALNSQK